MAIRPPTPSRHKARELALQVLYAVDHSEGARSRTARNEAAAGTARDADHGAATTSRDADRGATTTAPVADHGAADGPVGAPLKRTPERGAEKRGTRAAPTRRLPRAHSRKAAPIWVPTAPASAEETFEAVAEHFEMAPGARAFARELALATHAREGEVDELVSAHARNWRVDRMAVVDRNILRLATYELCFTDTPTAVVLDEAINLARRFGDDPSPSFVNGILDAVARGVRPSRP